MNIYQVCGCAVLLLVALFSTSTHDTNSLRHFPLFLGVIVLHDCAITLPTNTCTTNTCAYIQACYEKVCFQCAFASMFTLFAGLKALKCRVVLFDPLSGWLTRWFVARCVHSGVLSASLQAR